MEPYDLSNLLNYLCSNTEKKKAFQFHCENCPEILFRWEVFAFSRKMLN